MSAEHILESKEFDVIATQLAQIGRFFAERGWSPATSSNYSARLTNEYIAITRSGIDKFHMNPSDIILVNQDGQVAAPQGSKASAETLIHTAIYKKRPDAQAVLHTHSVPNTRLSLKHLANGYLNIQGYEMQKGLNGVTTHESVIRVPILANSQNMALFSQTVEELLDREPKLQGFLMAGHGLYTWGKDLPEAKRHIETFEFLFDCLRHEELGF